MIVRDGWQRERDGKTCGEAVRYGTRLGSTVVPLLKTPKWYIHRV
jgi:hypothetical protein